MKERSILKNKTFLYLTEFFSGMALMAVELCANRLLAPYFSSSQIVWTIIIGTIMIAMALGNIYGGRSADKNPDPARLYKRIMIAAVYIAAIPVVGKYIILAISGLLILSVNTGFLIWASFISCMVIFVFPLFLLGTVTPSLAKYTVSSLNESGRIVGTLGAFNTVGSIIGTFLPTFVTIPAVGASVTFLMCSGILLALGLVYFIYEKKNTVGCIVATVLFLICVIFGRGDRFAFWENNLAYEGESVYNYLQVQEGDRAVVLSTNVLFGVQSIHMKQGGLTGLYYDYALAAPVMAGLAGDPEMAAAAGTAESVSSSSDSPSMLILGMGTGTYASLCQRYFPWIRTEGVEIDEKITELAREFFYLSDDIPVTTYDGRAYLAADDRKYDIIMSDAYRDITIPFQMSSIEFFELVKSHLKPGGVLIMNMNMYSREEGGITDYLEDTVGRVFGTVVTVDVAGSTNRELFASDDPEMLRRFAEGVPNVKDEQLRTFLVSIQDDLQEHSDRGYVFTDDKAPVELLGMRVIDELIRDEMGYYKDIYEEEGLSGLIDSF